MTPDAVVRMANQIAANVPDPQRAAELTATHLRSFWAPAMIDELADVAARVPDRLTPPVHAALAELRPVEAARG